MDYLYFDDLDDVLLGKTLEERTLMHYGTKFHSGRYPWGSGKDPYQHSGDFLSRVRELKEQGLSETEIAKHFDISSAELRTQLSLAKQERHNLLADQAASLRDKGYTLDQIATAMGYSNDSSVRSLLNENAKWKENQAQTTAEFLKQKIAEKGIIDVGEGVPESLGISKEMMEQALYILSVQEGYPIYKKRVEQATNKGKFTTVLALCPEGTEYSDLYKDDTVINTVNDYVSHDQGTTYKPRFVYPASMDSSRLTIRYADDEDSGLARDGLIEIRRGVDDLSLGNDHYAQVRILVDGTHYLKGMAVYADDLPDGCDVRFNTNKNRSKGVYGTLKEIHTEDPNNPFGSLIKENGGQSYYVGEDGKEHLSLINKRASEGDWGEWSNKLPAQFLSKQSMQLINKQLSLTKAEARAELDTINGLTNPTVKKYFLESFARSCDSDAEDLQAMGLPSQKFQVILPLTTLKDNEVYAPNYNDGDTVALIRYPHGGTFEIPICTVNNKNKEGISLMSSNPKDAIGVSAKAAAKLSGADFDGDTVTVIPCNTTGKPKIIATKSLAALENFDDKLEYPERPGMTYMKYKRADGSVVDNSQTEMGKITNLIMDMTIKGATEDELARATRHSMVVIDAAKHKLDYKKSYTDNGIAALKIKYQGVVDPETGRVKTPAGTLITRAGSQVSVIKRRGSGHVDPETGEKTYDLAHDYQYVDKKTGKLVTKMQKSTQMAETKDAYTLSTGTPQEDAYADYANYMKALANEARKTSLATKGTLYSAEAKAQYKEEVDSLNAQVNLAIQNKPKERAAQIAAQSTLAAAKQDNPTMTKDDEKKLLDNALKSAREKYGASRSSIELTDKQWEAIQAGAISSTQLTKILQYTDDKSIKSKAMPKENSGLSATKLNMIKTMSASGYTNAEIANRLGVSVSSVIKVLD